MQIELVLKFGQRKGAPESFDHDIVHPAPLAIHADSYTTFLKNFTDFSIANGFASFMGSSCVETGDSH
jgi:hypothetical protein